jgi:hypothetical protein
VYPVTPGFLPPGLAAPSYSLDAQGIVAVWTARTGSSAPAALPTASIFVRVSPERAPAGADDAAQPVAVSPGVTGQLWNRPAEGFAALVFQRGTSWIKVGGQSSLASPDVLLRVARSLTDQVRPVDVSVSLAPDGWQLAAFKDDVTTYDDPASDDRTRSLTVTVAGRYDPSRVGDGLVKPTDVMVLGRTGSQAVRGNIRYLAFPLSDGRAVTLSAPADMSLADLVRIAETTRLTGTR